MSQRQLVLILGMGRSGTSALTRVLSLCGATLPETLLTANEANSAGYWEPTEALDLNEQFMFRHGVTWFDPTLRLQHEIAFDRHECEEFIKGIRALLNKWPAESILVVKEPRITVLANFWREAAVLERFLLRVIIPVRHPTEVTQSLAARDEASLELSSSLWLKNNLLAERCSRDLPRVFVEYSSLLGDWRTEIRRISDALSLQLNLDRADQIDEFLRHELRHQRESSPPVEVFDLPWIGQVYAIFCAAAKGKPCDARTLDAIYRTYAACEKSFRVSLDEFRSQFGPPKEEVVPYAHKQDTPLWKRSFISVLEQFLARYRLGLVKVTTSGHRPRGGKRPSSA